MIVMVEQNEIQEWIGQLRSDDMDQQREASRRLGAAGEVAVAPVIEALASSADNDQRWYLAVALARIGRPALDPLIAALRDRRDPEFRRYAAAALAELGEDAVDPLVLLLEVEGDTELRGFAAQALARIGDPAIERLREAVEAGGRSGPSRGSCSGGWRSPGSRRSSASAAPRTRHRRARPAPRPDRSYRIWREPGLLAEEPDRLAVQDQVQVRDHDVNRQQARQVLGLHAIDLRQQERRPDIGKVLREPIEHAGLGPAELALVGLERGEHVPRQDTDLPLTELPDQPAARRSLGVSDQHDLACEDEEDREKTGPGHASPRSSRSRRA